MKAVCASPSAPRAAGVGVERCLNVQRVSWTGGPAASVAHHQTLTGPVSESLHAGQVVDAS